MPDAKAIDSKRGHWRLRVTYADTDQARVVHHGTYIRYLEIARIEFLRANGFDYDRFEKESGLGLPVVEVGLRYRVPARFDDQLDIETWIIAANRASMTFGANVRKINEPSAPVLLCETSVRVACADLNVGGIRSIPPALLDAVLIR